MRGRILAVLALGALAFAGVASAQNLSLRGPPWAQALLSADTTPTTGGRATLADPGLTYAVRVTIAPMQGGVARVIRIEQRGDQTLMALRRFTGHPSSGWWIWGPDTPFVSHPTAAQRDEVAGLVRGAIGVGATLGSSPDESCPSGEQVFVEMAQGDRSISASRACIDSADPVARLAKRVSDLAGSRNEDELLDAATAELLAADVAFNAKAQAQGVAAAVAEYAAEDAIAFNGATPVEGHDAVAALFHDWPAGARLQWAPQTARVSERGDMGWTWGRSTQIGADGSRREGRYVTTWRRDYEGHWRFAFNAALRDAPAAAPRAAAPAQPPATTPAPAH